MNILVVSQYFYPEQFQINEIVEELVKRGNEVTVLTGLPNYPGGEIFQGYETSYGKEEDYKGAKVIRFKMRPRKKGTVNLLLNYFSFYKNAGRRLNKLKDKFDIVYNYQLSPVTSSLPAVKFAKRNKIPLFLYCLDIWPESAQSYIRNTKGIVYKIIKKISKKVYTNCDEIGVTSRPFIDYLEKEHGVERQKIVYLPQHYDTGYLNTDFSKPVNDTVDFMYAGNFGKGQRLDVIIDAIPLIKTDKVFKVHFVGDGSQREILEEKVKKQGLSDIVVFHGNKTREEMSGFYKAADALLLTLRGNNFVGNTMPGKLQAYMSTGKPIIASINGSANEVIKESGCGLCVGAEDPAGLAGIMTQYLNNPEIYRENGKKGRRYFAGHFTLDIHITALEKEFERLVCNGI